LAVEIVKRAEVILMLASGHSYRDIRERLNCSDEYIRQSKKPFQGQRLAGLDSVIGVVNARRGQPRAREIHIVADNLSSHKTKTVFDFLPRNQKVRIHYTPTYRADSIRFKSGFPKFNAMSSLGGIFTSTPDLSRKLS
jgi:transposase